jgi:hypothetical protein
LEASRLAGGDASIFLKSARLEVGESYQHLLQDHQINSSGTYVSWQPEKFPLDLKAEFDRSFNGEGYWIEGAYKLSQVPVAPSFFSRVQLVPRMQQVIACRRKIHSALISELTTTSGITFGSFPATAANSVKTQTPTFGMSGLPIALYGPSGRGGSNVSIYSTRGFCCCSSVAAVPNCAICRNRRSQSEAYSAR